MKIKHASLLLCLTVLLSACKAIQSAQEDTIMLDERLRRIQMTDLKGKAVSWASLRGKPVVLNFWATWCAPCVAEMNSIQYLHRQMGEQVQIIAVSNEHTDKISAFKKSRALEFGFTQLQGEYIDAFVIELPTTLLINAEGKIVEEIEGGQSWSSPHLMAKVKGLIP